ncbi:ADP-ribosylglycohydrolase family protein [Asticcacaulis solisilvae]|uniref:ADP-ribosylglycohydrolase family protein n=1 Tax=Asticcacaulis solisilvae TaxID=1217274 RepID=UPI003FD7499F
MLLEMAIGDAYGAAFEFMPDDFLARENDLSGYKRNPETQLGDGRYTDDTQMAIAIAEHLLDGGAFDAESLAARFVATFKRDPRRGYSKRLYEVLQGADDGPAFLKAIAPVSDRSGAAMRVSPIGLLPDIAQVLDLAGRQAALTHDTPGGRTSAAAVAAMVHYLAHDVAPRRALGRFIESHVPGHAWSAPWTGRADMAGISCAHAAISLVAGATTLSGLLHDAIALGGDTDTVAAMALFSGRLSRDIAADLPPALHDGLENGAYGADFLRGLDARLMIAFPRRIR